MEEKDRDMLIETHTTVKRIDRWCYNHDEHHQQRESTAWKIIIGLVVTLFLALLTLG